MRAMFRTMEKLIHATVKDRFFSPLKDALETATNARRCDKLPDWDFLRAGVGRCIQTPASGRAWVQHLHHFLSRCAPVTVTNFFTGLRSGRRLDLVREVNEKLVAQCAQQHNAADPFFGCSELDDFAVWAADGHYHQCSTHDAQVGGRKRAPGHLFALNLRSLALRHLDVARPGLRDGRKKEHDISVLKRLPASMLRMGEPKGKKVLMVYDPAVIDFGQWYKWKKGSGIYILTREKKNMKLQVIGEHEYDRSDPRNNGIVADQLAGHSKGRTVRRITYTDPVSGKTYRFITNEITLPPGLLAYIYRKRWDIEKVFDEIKNRMNEKKAWGKTDEAKCQQANFICLTHNLLVLLEDILEAEEGMLDNKVLRRRRKRIRDQAAKAEAAGRPMNSLLLSRAARATQRSVQFLRWLRHELLAPTSWRSAVACLRPLMENYL